MTLVLDGQKLQWHKDRVASWLRGERIAPITIETALTRSCNFSCQYCYGKLQVNEIKHMTWDIIRNFLEDAKEIGVKSVNFTGDGESTCSPYFSKAIIYGNHIGLDMAVGTNLSLLTEKELELILPCLTYIRVNISAADSNSYSIVHGTSEGNFYKVIANIKACVKFKKLYKLPVTIGLQMVLMPDLWEQVIPLAKLGRSLEVDYLVIKHCSDDEFGSLGIDYSKYDKLIDLLKETETYSTSTYSVQAKWSKILSGGKRSYSQCYGPPFMLQMSGSGLVAPCGMLFNDRYKELYHIGNIAETRFKDIFNSDRYWEVMDRIASDKFDAHTMCGSLCFQHKANEYLWGLKKGMINLEKPKGEKPQHINFV